jgi:1,4-dihydroxy-2-naphthoyl-CoA hydrolase
MAIWTQDVKLGPTGPDSPFPQANTIGALIGLRITEIGEDFLRGTLPVDGRTRQPFGRLHGGASCVLAEELGSIAATLCLDSRESIAVGLEINANHVRGIFEGTVTGTARPLHLGRSTQVWDIRIEDERQRLVCISRLTVAVIARARDRK